MTAQPRTEGRTEAFRPPAGKKEPTYVAAEEGRRRTSLKGPFISSISAKPQERSSISKRGGNRTWLKIRK